MRHFMQHFDHRTFLMIDEDEEAWMISVISWRGEELAAYATEMTQWFEERGIAGVEEHSPFDYRFRYLVLPNVGLEFVLRFRNDDFREFLPSAEVLKVQKISFEPWVIRIRSE